MSAHKFRSPRREDPVKKSHPWARVLQVPHSLVEQGLPSRASGADETKTPPSGIAGDATPSGSLGTETPHPLVGGAGSRCQPAFDVRRRGCARTARPRPRQRRLHPSPGRLCLYANQPFRTAPGRARGSFRTPFGYSRGRRAPRRVGRDGVTFTSVVLNRWSAG